MNFQKLPRPNQVKHLSEIERRFIMLARRQRARDLRLFKRIKAAGCNNGSHALMIVVCAVALLATTASAESRHSAPGLFNEANAAQRGDRLGPAILGYERARLLSPNESSIEQNLRIAREKAGVNAPAIPAWQRPAHWLGFDSWALLGSSALSIGCALFFAIRYVPRRAVPWIAATCGAAVLLAATAIGLRWNELDRAVIQNAHTSAHIAPATDAQSTFELKAGEIVTAQREYGDFVLVRTLDQRSGWVKKADVERVIPATDLSLM
jgi:hypothetical protein